MAQKTILCVDNDKHVLELLSFNLQSAGYTVLTAATAAEALTASYCVDLILIDPLLPDMDGLEVLRRLKAAPATASIPVVVLSEKDGEEDKVLAFELGANDYVTKPFSVRILLARVKALLRNNQRNVGNEGKIINGPITIDCDNYEAFHNEEKLQLPLLEYKVLKFLTMNIGKVCARSMIFDNCWGYDTSGNMKMVDTYIKRLRIKLGVDREMIQTVRGVGYKMVKA